MPYPIDFNGYLKRDGLRMAVRSFLFHANDLWTWTWGDASTFKDQFFDVIIKPDEDYIIDLIRNEG